VHIGFVLYGSIDALTGGYLYDRYLVDYLRRVGHRVTLLTLPSRTYWRRYLDNLSNTLCDRIAKMRLDMLVQDELCHPSLLRLNRLLRRRWGRPVIALVHHLNCREPRSYWVNQCLSRVEKRYLDSVDGFIFNSRTTKDQVVNMSPRNRPQVVARPGGNRLGRWMAPDDISRRAMALGPLKLFFLGAVIPRKGLLQLIHALYRLKTRKWRLDVVGDTAAAPAYANRVRKTIHRYGLGLKIRMWGRLDDETLRALLIQSHVLCMPFAYEGFGIAAVEAFNFGLPVMGLSQGATREIVCNGRTGYLFAFDDEQAVARAISDLISHRRRLVEMGLAAVAKAEKLPTWQDCVERIESFLTKAVVNV
jgi:glycosyltransferase involved in cell wall biosynthesis